MRDLLTIGQFSNLTRLTVKALRLYDRLGVLQPAVVDLASGYRYYRPDQAVTAQRICLLRALDMPLADIRALLAETDPDTLRQRLERHRQFIESRIADYQDGLTLLQTLDDWTENVTPERADEHTDITYACAFCGRTHTAVHRMIAGRYGGLICSECVEKCNLLLAEEQNSMAEPEGEPL